MNNGKRDRAESVCGSRTQLVGEAVSPVRVVLEELPDDGYTCEGCRFWISQAVVVWDEELGAGWYRVSWSWLCDECLGELLPMFGQAAHVLHLRDWKRREVRTWLQGVGGLYEPGRQLPKWRA